MRKARALYRLAIIGSRETEKETMDEMYINIRRGLQLLKDYGFDVLVVSGGCWKGPDQIQFTLARYFEGETWIKFVCYLPDEKKMWLKNRYPNVDFRVIPQNDTYHDIVAKLHPAPAFLSEVAYQLHGRNLNIISGDDLETPVDAVYYSAKHDKKGNAKGGTFMGVAFARMEKVPVYNHADGGVKWFESIRALDEAL